MRPGAAEALGIRRRGAASGATPVPAGAILDDASDPIKDDAGVIEEEDV